MDLSITATQEENAAAVVDALVDLVGTRDPVHVGLTGGSMGVAVAAEIGRRWAGGEADLGGVHWWFSDERHLPAGDGERNAVQVHDALGAAPLDDERFHVVPPPADDDEPDRLDAEDAAVDYAEAMQVIPQRDGLPVLDVVMLGVGPDAHVASLFPGHPDSATTGVWTTAVDDSPKPPPLRVSFTMEVIRSAEEVWLVASGDGKAEAMERAVEVLPEHVDQSVEDLEGEPLDVPAGWATGRSATRWFLDEAAASRLVG
ncbi:6-phosphogluconolactonase [Kytococcus sedentarius]|uniref:6-phosphogluconolactonase n=1 Tax=Kytococcus sedentarius TaxID=1276 RepID=UPI0035BC3CE2